jgi:flavin reductase (DIM6/NTAB) family NADH-FMN oxidoreductase RutF
MTEAKFKDAMARIPTNVSILGSFEADRIRACTISSLVSVDIVDPTVMFVLKKSSATLANIESTKNFSVNVLNSNQSSLSEKYSNKREEIEDLNDSISWSNHVNSVPVIKDAHLIFFCKMVSALEIENSTIVFARVMEIWTGDSKNPLVYFDRKYFGL